MNNNAGFYFELRRVYSGSIGTTTKRQNEINDAIATERAARTSKRVARLIQRPAKEDDLHQRAIDLSREVRDAQSAFIKSCSWWSDANDDQQEQVLLMIVMLHAGRISPAEYRVAVKGIAESVSGSVVASPQYYRPAQHPWRIPGGW